MFFQNRDKSLTKYKRMIPKIKEFCRIYQSQESLKFIAVDLHRRYQNGEELGNLLPEAFGLCNESMRRVLGIEFYDCQFLGGIALHDARIAELKTGEGKTYVSFLAGFLNSFADKNIHIVTANEYLAKRDKELLEGCYNLLGATVGLSLQGMSVAEKKENYQHHITYSTATEIGFDYLRDNLVYNPEHKVLKGLNYVIIDEIDSILLDDARVPLIISSPGDYNDEELYYKCDKFILSLSESDYEFITKKEVQLTDTGAEKIEKFFDININNPLYYRISHHVNNALKAHMVMKKDRDYIIVKGKLELIDAGTGRIAIGRQYCSGLHQAIERKEGIPITDYNKTVGSITYQNLFHEYSKICGMTGTAKTDEEEFKDIYNLDVIQIPTNMPVARLDMQEQIYNSMEGKYRAVVEEIGSNPQRPVLVGCTTIKDAENLSRLLLDSRIKHKLLTAKNLEEEARIISLSGRLGSVTLSTNIAGRGTDIVLEKGVNEAGGLLVIGVGQGENIRINNQLRGRSGRQGDNGISKFFISLDEEIINPLEDERIDEKLSKIDITTKKGMLQALNIVKKSQKTYSDIGYQVRKNLAELDDFVHMLRLLLYREREIILNSNNPQTCISYMGKTFSALYSTKFLTKEFRKLKQHIQIEVIQKFFDKILFHGQLEQENFHSPLSEYQDYISGKVSNVFLLKTTSYKDNINRITKDILLFSIDEIIIELLDNVEFMRISYFITPQKDKNDWLKSVDVLHAKLLESLEIRILQRIFNLP